MQKRRKAPIIRPGFGAHAVHNEFLHEKETAPKNGLESTYQWPQFGRAAKVSNAALLTYCGVISVIRKD